MGGLNEKEENSDRVCHGDGQDYGALRHNFLTYKDSMKSSFKASHFMIHMEGIQRFISKQ